METWTNLEKMSLEFSVEIIHYPIIVITSHEMIFFIQILSLIVCLAMHQILSEHDLV